MVGPSVCFVRCNRHAKIFTDGSKYVHKIGAFIINTRAYGQKVVMIMTKIVRFYHNNLLEGICQNNKIHGI